MANENQEQYYPIAVLIDELRNEDIYSRMNSIKHLSTIALALGPEKTRTQLIPFLTDSIYDEEDVLISLTEEFIKLIDYVGGPKYVHVLLQPLETFAAVEEGVVREKGVQALRKIAFYHSQDDIRDHFYPLVQRYGNSQWFGTKCSAVSLFPVIYPRITTSMKDKIFEMLQKIIEDEIPLVRKAAAARIGELAIVMLCKMKPHELVPDLPVSLDLAQDHNKENLDTFTNPQEFNYDMEMDRFRTVLIPFIKRLWTDKHEPVRLALLQSVVEIACALDLKELVDTPSLKEIITEAVNDGSWRVRCIAADRFPSIIKVFGEESRLELTCLYTKLLRDEEAEVRLVSLNKSKSIAYHLVGKEEAPETIEANGDNRSKELFKNEMDLTEKSNGPSNNRILFNSDPNNSNDINSYFGNNTLSTMNPIDSPNNPNNNSPLSSDSADAKNANSILQKKLSLINNFVNFDSISFGDVDYLIFRINPYENAIALKEYSKKVLETKESRVIQLDENGQAVLLNDKNVALHKDSKSEQPSNGDTGTSEDLESSKSDGQDIILKNLIPSLLELSTDGTIVIRIGLANSIMSILPLLPKESIQHLLLPTIMNQLSDTNSDVRLNLISRFEYLKDVIGTEQFFGKLIPAIETLASDKKWRIRLGVMNYILLLAEKFGSKIFSESLMSFSINFLYDTSYAIRLAAVTNLTKLGIIFGSKWAYNLLMPSILKDLSKEENYLFRMMCLEVIISFVEVIEATEETLEKLLTETLAFSKDIIPNVRFKAAQALSRVGLKVSETSVKTKILPRLNEMLKDSDCDVVFFADESIRSLNGESEVEEKKTSDVLPVAEPMDTTATR